ncbi:MAG: hypothetical protein RIB71_26375 [Imperialibacter sp.]|uniref:hypothetical protein n=1 Tax=Imperialibacter sp. TaxID=2038411 RepID=UPI0032F03C0D
MDNHLTIGLSGGWGGSIGATNTASNGYFTPALFSNYDKLSSLSLFANYSLSSFLNVGLTGSSVHFSDWNYPDDAQTYEGANSTIKSLSPSLRIFLPYRRARFRNRLKPFLEVFLVNSSISSTLAYLPFGEKESFEGTTSKAFNFGYGGRLGFNLALTNKLGFQLTYGVTKHRLKSKLYDDTSVIFAKTEMGIFYRGLLTKKLF